MSKVDAEGLMLNKGLMPCLPPVEGYVIGDFSVVFFFQVISSARQVYISLFHFLNTCISQALCKHMKGHFQDLCS